MQAEIIHAKEVIAPSEESPRRRLLDPHDFASKK
jgi:hypothetical protein